MGFDATAPSLQDSEKARIVGDLLLQKRLKLTQCRGEPEPIWKVSIQRALSVRLTSRAAVTHESALRKSDRYLRHMLIESKEGGDI
jgi:hypothetical protein